MEQASAAAQPYLLSLVTRIADGDGGPYELANELYRAGMAASGPGGPSGEKGYVLWRVWAEFDDIAAYLGIRTERVEHAMREAARDWLAICTTEDHEVLRAYHDRWLPKLKALIESERNP